jgi:hypothetical protein
VGVPPALCSDAGWKPTVPEDAGGIALFLGNILQSPQLIALTLGTGHKGVHDTQLERYTMPSSCEQLLICQWNKSAGSICGASGSAFREPKL